MAPADKDHQISTVDALPRAALVVMLLLVMYLTTSHCSAAAQDVAPLVQISPLGQRFYAVATDPNAPKVYVAEYARALNLWSLAVYYWPELLALLLLIIAPVFLLALRRVIRRPRVAGELHCRKCNYQLTALKSES